MLGQEKFYRNLLHPFNIYYHTIKQHDGENLDYSYLANLPSASHYFHYSEQVLNHSGTEWRMQNPFCRLQRLHTKASAFAAGIS